MSASGLAVLLSGRHVADLVRTRRDTLKLTYLDDYARPGNTPLSLTLPPAERVFSGHRVSTYLDSLIPESPEALRAVEHTYGIDARDRLALLDVIGLDCAGAVQLIGPERIDDALSRSRELEPATDVEYRLAQMRLSDEASWMMPGEHWSLNGMQQKFTLRRQSDAWFYPRGSAASTHIIKPGVRTARNQALIEHLTMRAVGLLGGGVARTDYLDFGAERAIVVERFDREHSGAGEVIRLHQEDLCQASGNREKYEEHGGPGVAELVRLLREVSPTARSAERNVRRFLDGVVLNTALSAPDAHARNYAVLLQGDSVDLAPLYDVASGLAYQMPPGRPRLASMSIGGTFDLEKIDRERWLHLGEEIGMDGAALAARARDVRENAPEAFERAAAEIEDWDGAVTDVMGRIRPQLALRRP